MPLSQKKLRQTDARRIILEEIKDLTTHPLKEIDQAVSKLGDCEIVDYKLELVGVCPACQAVKPKSSQPAIQE